MILQIEKQFEKDLQKLKQPILNKQLLKLLQIVKEAKSVEEVRGIKKLLGYPNFYRIRIGDYRVGLEIEGDVVIFIRCLHRKDIYKYFPKE